MNEYEDDDNPDDDAMCATCEHYRDQHERGMWCCASTRPGWDCACERFEQVAA